jgi:hypothetical protein
MAMLVDIGWLLCVLCILFVFSLYSFCVRLPSGALPMVWFFNRLQKIWSRFIVLDGRMADVVLHE